MKRFRRPHRRERGVYDMSGDASRSIACGVTSTLMLMMLVTSAAAQSQKLTNIDLCNGNDRTSAEPQIIGCTALIQSDADNPKVLVIAYNNRGNAYSGKGQYDLAIQDYNESIKLNPNYAKSFNNRGVAYQKKGEYDRAIEDFDAAIKIDPDYANAFANRGETYQKKSDYPRALKDFDEALRQQPTLGVVWNERCWTRAVIGELEAALADCNEAIRLKPNVAATFNSRGFTYLKLGQWELAIADFNSALRLDSKLAKCAVRPRVRQAEEARSSRRKRRHCLGKDCRTEYRGGIRSLWAALGVQSHGAVKRVKLVRRRDAALLPIRGR